MIRVQVPATTANLGPGFDCLGMALELYNIIELIPASRGLVIEASGEGAAEIPRDERNLVYQAAQHHVAQEDKACRPHGLMSGAGYLPVHTAFTVSCRRSTTA